MQIKELDFSAQHNRLDEAFNTRSHPVSTTDVGFFNSSLERSALPATRVGNEPGPTLLAEAGQHVKALESRLAHALKSTNKGADPDDFKQYPRELSNVVLTSQLLVKSLGKATQCIDKISNLQ